MPEYSIFQLDKFEECALQYKFIYVDGIKRYEEGVEAFLGQRFHDAMEWLYKERTFRVVPLEELLEHYEQGWAGKLIGIRIFTLGVNKRLDKLPRWHYPIIIHP